MTEGPGVNFVMREALFEIYTWMLCLSYLHEKQTSRIILYQNCPVLAMKYPFLNTQQGAIQNSRRSSRLIRHACRFMKKMDVKIFLMFIVAENTRGVNIV